MSNPPSSHRSLYITFLWTVMGVISVSFISAGFIGSYFGANRVVRQRTASMEQIANILSPQVKEVLSASEPITSTQNLAERLSKKARSRITLVKPDGVVVGDSERTLETLQLMDNHGKRPEIKEALQGRVGSIKRYSNTIKTNLLYVALPIREKNRIIGVIRVAIPLSEVDALKAAISRTVAVSLGVGFIVALILSMWFSRRITNPISCMTRIAESVAEGNLEIKAPSASIREVDALGQALNRMGKSLKQYITSLSTERNQAKAILESMDEGVIALDVQGRILLVNSSAEKLLGIDPSKAVGTYLIETLRYKEIHELINKVESNYSSASCELVIFHPTERMLKVAAVPCERCDTEGPCIILVLQDMTELNRYDHLRKQFVTNVTHELKSPLTAIRGLTETLQEGAIDDSVNNRRFVSLINEETNRLTRLIDDLLQLAKIEAGKTPPKWQAVHIKELVSGLLPMFQIEAGKRRITIDVKLDGLPEVKGDADKLRQVFINLIDNAIKYNLEGGLVTISASMDGSILHVNVADTGIGIPEKDMPHIFERFYRVDKARSRQLGGTGLGLSIVKHIVEIHGGRVSIDSALDKGSKVTFTLPTYS